MEPEWNIVGQIIFKSGQKRYFKYSSIDLNPLGASEIAKDKDYAGFFMKKMGYPVVPKSMAFYSKDWAHVIGVPSRGIDAAWRYSKKIGLPVIVKPNSGCQGAAVRLVHNKHDFYRAARAVFKRDRIVLVQEQLEGRDYRLVVLDNKVISAYERIPLNVIGDGRSTILQLLKAKQQRFAASSRDTRIKLEDPRMIDKMKRQGLSFKSVPAKGKRVYLLDNANLSTGGNSVDVTDKVHPSFRKLALKLTKDMGLRLCGVDIIVQGDIAKKPKNWWVLEVNAAPGLDHYAKTGKAQEKIVEKLYLEVLKSMERGFAR